MKRDAANASRSLTSKSKCNLFCLFALFALFGLAPLCFPIALYGLAISLEFHFALDAVAANLAAVLCGDCVAVDLAGRGEGNFVALDLAVLNLRLAYVAVAARKTDFACYLLALD